MTKKIAIFLISLGLSDFVSIAGPGPVQEQINEQVWRKFIKAFNNGDNGELKLVHSHDLVRVIQDENQVLSYRQYFKDEPESARKERRNWKKQLELRFSQRIAGDGKAFEVGFYKTTSTNASTGEKRTSYGKFHVLLRREHGVWKILMDADAHDRTDEAVFMTGEPM